MTAGHRQTRRRRCRLPCLAVSCLAVPVLLGMAALAMPAQADTQPPLHAPVPAAWSRYAAAVSRQLQASLADSHNPAATRFHRFLDDQANTSQKTPALVVKLWIWQNGKIARAEFASLGNAQANADLGAVILKAAPQTPPPRSLPQPLILRLQLTYPI